MEKNRYAGLQAVLGGCHLVVSDVNYDEEMPDIIMQSGEEELRYISNGVECIVKAYQAAKIGYCVENYITEVAQASCTIPWD